jgi:hypothetical protein
MALHPEYQRSQHLLSGIVEKISWGILGQYKMRGFRHQDLQYIKSESKAALTAAGWMREGLVEMRKSSLYHSVLAAILSKLKVCMEGMVGLRLRGKGTRMKRSQVGCYMRGFG